MQVGDALPGILSIIDDHPVTAGKVFLEGDLAGDQQEMAEKGLVLLSGFKQPGKGFFRNDQDMDGGLGIDIADGEGQIILIGDVGRYFPGQDFLK